MLKVYEEDEKLRFARLCSIFKERGGGKGWDWKATDIEMLLVRLGLEDPAIDESTRIRRRRRSAGRRGDKLNHPDSTATVMVQSWNSGYTQANAGSHTQYPLPQPYQQHNQQAHQHQQAQPSQQPPHSSPPGYENTHAAILTPNYSDEQANRILDQLNDKYGVTVVDAASPLGGHSMSNSNSAASNGQPAVVTANGMLDVSNGTGGTAGLPRTVPSPAAGMPSVAGPYGRVQRDTYDQSHIKTEMYR